MLSILAGQNKVLAKLAVDSDQALAPLAKVRENFANFIVQSNTVAQASAAQRGSLQQNLALFPPFLERARAGDGTPRTLRRPDHPDLHGPAQGGAVHQQGLRGNLPAFSKGSNNYFTSLGKNGKITGPAIVATKPLLRELKSLGTRCEPVLHESLRPAHEPEGHRRPRAAAGLHLPRHGRVERIRLAGSLPAHRRRGQPLPEILHRARTPNVIGTSCNKGTAPATNAASSKKEGTSLVMERTLAVIEGASPAQALAKYPGSARRSPKWRAPRAPPRAAARPRSPSAAPPPAPPTTRPPPNPHRPADCCSTTCSGTERYAMSLRPDTMRLLLAPVAAVAIGLALPASGAAADRKARRPAPSKRPRPRTTAAPETTTPHHRNDDERARRRSASDHPAASSAASIRRARARNAPPAGSAGKSPSPVDRRHIHRRSGPQSGKHAASPSALTPALPLAAAVLGRAVSRRSSSKASRSRHSCCRSSRRRAPPMGSPGRCSPRSTRSRPTTGATCRVSSAGAEGWMQFLPADVGAVRGRRERRRLQGPLQPRRRDLCRRPLPAGGRRRSEHQGGRSTPTTTRQAYVDSVMLRAELLGGTPSELLGAVTGLTEARFPVHAAAHFSDGFPSVERGRPSAVTDDPRHHDLLDGGRARDRGAGRRNRAAGQLADARHFVSLRDAYGNTYIYARARRRLLALPGAAAPGGAAPAAPTSTAPDAQEPAPSGPASAGAQPRSPLSEAGTASGLTLGASAGLEGAAEPRRASRRPRPRRPPRPPATRTSVQ